MPKRKIKQTTKSKGKSHVATILLPKNKFTEKQAKKWVKEHGFKVSKLYKSDNYYRFRQLDPKYARFLGTETIKDGIKFVYAKPG